MTDLIKDVNHTGPYLFMLVGLPGVGKSTFRKEAEGHCVVLSTDDLIEDIAQAEGKTYDEVWEDNVKQAESAMRAAMKQAFKDRANVIIDRTNLSKKKRRGLLMQVPVDYFKIALSFDLPEPEEHARRLNRPGKVIPPFVMENMFKMFQEQPVELEEGWDLITTVPAQ